MVSRTSFAAPTPLPGQGPALAPPLALTRVLSQALTLVLARALALALTLTLALGGSAGAATAVLNLNPAVTVNSFSPLQAFGANVMFWDGIATLNAVQPQTLQAGTQYIRYPGGSSSDDFHWNGIGSFNAGGAWVPDDTNYGISWYGFETWRGTTSSYGVASNLTDGNPATFWLSNADTDFPNAQWAYVDLGSAQKATSITIQWGTPYATSFKVQYWNSSSGWPQPYDDQTVTSLWTDTTAGTVAGSGGTQTVSFSAPPITSQFWRVLLLASSTAPAQYSIGELTLFNGGTQLTVNTPTVTNGTPVQSNATVSSTDPACSMNSPTDLDFVTFMGWLRSLGPQAKPLITVNFGTGTPQEAAAWVHYANVVMGYGIKDWQVGNELDGSWETGGPLNADDYARRYMEYFNAMKAVDPTIQISGPVVGSPYAGSNLFDGNYFIQDFIDRMASDPGGNQAGDAEGIDFHWYPGYGTSTTDNQALAYADDIKQLAQTDLPAMLANHPNPTTVPILMTEYNGGVDLPNTVHLENALWLADTLGQCLFNWGSRFSAHVWDLVEGGDADTNLTGTSLGMLNANAGPWLYQQRAHYWAMQMLTQDWSTAADSSPHSLVQATSSQVSLTAYADLRPDKVLSLLVINKDSANAYTATINFTGFTPAATAPSWTFGGANYAWNTSAAPYHAAPDSPPSAGSDAGVASGYTHTFAPYSITVLQFSNGALPQVSATPSATPMPSPTPTPTFGPFTLIDDFEDPSRDGVPPSRVNLWNGKWGEAAGSGTVQSVTYQAPGAASTSYGLSWTSQVAGGSWSDISTGLPYTFDASGAGDIGLQFWAWGDGNSYWCAIQTAGVTDYNWYGVAITPPAGKWTLYQIPFSTMRRQAGWGSMTPAPSLAPSATDITGLQWGTYGPTPGNYTLRLDQIGFYMASELGTPTPSLTLTASRTPSPTATASPCATPSPCATASPSCTLSATQSPVLSATPTLSVSQSFTQTASFSASPTLTPSATVSATATPSPSWSPTPSQGPSLTATQSSSPAPTLTPTPSLNPAAGSPSEAILAARPWPVPLAGKLPLTLAVQLAGTVQKIHVRIYDRSYAVVDALDTDGGGPGWLELALPTGLTLANGAYFLRVWASNGGQVGSAQRAVIFVAR